VRLQRLNLVKYGKFSDRIIEFPDATQDFHLIIGPNEAGKSTFRTAILDLFFGIPARSSLGFLHGPSELRLGASVTSPIGALEFQRIKAQKNTLRSPTDSVLADAELAQFLGSADRNFFDQMFGLDHTRLVNGGNSILKAENDVGQILFQSAAGVASLGRVRDELVAEADKLWAPRKSAERAYYVAADQLDKATLASKDATVRTKAWAELNSSLEALTAALEDERARHRGLLIRKNVLERVRRLAPFLQTLRENEKQLNDLGETVELPPDASNIFALAERELATAQLHLELRSAEVETAEDSLRSLTVDTALLGEAADVVKLEELRVQYRPYERDIERRQTEVASLWGEICDACAQLSWKPESEIALADRLPKVLVRRELGQLARDYSGLAQAVRAAGQAETTKLLEIESLSKQLNELQSRDISPSFRVALGNARSFGDAATAIQKQQSALNKAKAALEAALRGLGPWRRTPPELASTLLPSAKTISGLMQEQQALHADLKAALRRRDEQAAAVAKTELEIAQFKELHHPTTRAEVISARAKRDISWSSLKTGSVDLQQGAEQFEAAISDADTAADSQVDSVEDATELQSRLHQLEREKQAVATTEEDCKKLTCAQDRSTTYWSTLTADLGLSGISLDDIGEWGAKKEAALVAVEAYEEAQESFDATLRTIAELENTLTTEIQAAGLKASHNNLEALRAHAEAFLEAVDATKIRHEALTSQLMSARSLLTQLQHSLKEAKDDLHSWTLSWSRALSKSGLEEDSSIEKVEGALELISLIEEKLAKARQIRIERIDAMNADLMVFAAEAVRLAQAAAPELLARSPDEIAQELTQRLAQAQKSDAERARLRKVLHDANVQVTGAQESIKTTIAGLGPLTARAGVSSNVLLAEAIARSDKLRSLRTEADEITRRLLDGGDGLSLEQIQAEVDTVDLDSLVAELAQMSGDLEDVAQRLSALSADHANAANSLSEIGGSDSAAIAEGQRQEALAQMSDVAERYVKVFTAGRLLRWSIDRYREEKQGPMLARAGAIFANLTQGSFARLVVDFDHEPMALEGQRSDGTLVGISGMSDGTRDQLYLALRLAALELHLEQAPPLPFIADDLFINYDGVRSKSGLEALAVLSERTQVIFLSHHDHLVSTVREVFGAGVNVVVL